MNTPHTNLGNQDAGLTALAGDIVDRIESLLLDLLFLVESFQKITQRHPLVVGKNLIHRVDVVAIQQFIDLRHAVGAGFLPHPSHLELLVTHQILLLQLTLVIFLLKSSKEIYLHLL